MMENNDEIKMMETVNDNGNGNSVEAVTPGPTPVEELKVQMNTEGTEGTEPETADTTSTTETTEDKANFAQQMTDAIYSAHSKINEAVMENQMQSESTKTTELSSSTLPQSQLSPQLVKEQIKYCQRILKGLKRHREAGPFLLPVDPVALNIPDYFTVIKHPMDLSTISKKCDLNEYANADAFIADVRLMLTNCFTYNAPESQVTKMGRNLEKYFNTAMSKLPTELGAAGASASSSSLPPAIESPSTSRPKRESVVNVSVGAISGTPAVRRGSAASAATLSFCSSVLRELMKKTNAHLNWPFMIPVDPVALNIPDYFDVIKQPMDLGTIRKKLDTGMYTRPEQFESDVRLVFSNCYTYNPPESDVTKMARELESIFEQKMAQKPAPKPAHVQTHSSTPAQSSATVSVSGSAASSMTSLPFIPSSASQLIPGLDALEDDSEKILAINHQIQILQAELNYLLINRNKSGSSASISGSKSASHAASAPAKPKKKSVSSGGSAAGASTLKSSSHAAPAPLDEMTFEEKRQLSEDVSNLPQENMMRVLEIIQECMPNLHSNGDSDVIELDIEALDVRTLRALQSYIWECLNPGKKRTKPNATKTGGVKKTKEDVNVEAVVAPAAVQSGAYDSSSSSSSEDDD